MTLPTKIHPPVSVASPASTLTRQDLDSEALVVSAIILRSPSEPQPTLTQVY